MALDDAAVVFPTTAHFFTGTVGSATKPSLAAIEAFIDSGTAISGLTELGHTSLDEVVAFGSDGGDSEVHGSLQNKSLREVFTSEAVDYFTAKSLQLKDNEILKLYYGGGDDTQPDEFALPDSPQIQERAVLMIADAASGPVGLWVEKASVKRDDTISMPSDDFTQLPLRFTYLKVSGKPKAVWIADGLGTAA